MNKIKHEDELNLDSDDAIDVGQGMSTKFDDPLSSNTRYKCEKCEMTYSKTKYLRNHMLREHGIKLEPKSQLPKLVPTLENPRPYKCDQCEKDYTWLKHLRRHQQQTHQGANSIITVHSFDMNKATTSEIGKENGLPKKRVPFLKDEERICEYNLCDKNYKSSNSLNRHKKLEHTNTEKAFDNNKNYFEPIIIDPLLTMGNKLIKHEPGPLLLSEQKSCENNSELNSSYINIEPLNDIIVQEGNILSEELNRQKLESGNSNDLNTVKYNYRCENCQMIYATRQSLGVHMLREHGIKLEREAISKPTEDNPRPYQCDSCPKNYTCRKHLSRHLEITHQKKTEKTNNNSLITRYTRNAQDTQQINGNEQLDSVFASDSEINGSTTNLPKSRCSNNIDKKIIQKYDNLKKTVYRHRCEECKKMYVKRTSLAKHMLKQHNLRLPSARAPKLHLTEDNPRPYKCDTCSRTYLRKKHLTRHVKETHEQRICDQCFLPITTSYIEHIQKSHGVVVPYLFECDICSRKFRTKPHMQAHIMQAHVPSATNKVYICKFCNKEMSNKRLYRNHVRTHANSSRVVCYVCGVTVNYSGLRKHLLIHSDTKPHQCSICNRRFREKATLIIHMRTHTGEKPFNCRICGKGFKDASTRRIHYRSHNGESPYICHLCGRRTKQASNLRSHYKHFHKNTEISGREIRFNARIFAKFTQEQLDTELTQFGNFIRLLARGRAECSTEIDSKETAEEKEDTSVKMTNVSVETKTNVMLPIAEPVIESDSDDFNEDSVVETENNSSTLLSLHIELGSVETERLEASDSNRIVSDDFIPWDAFHEKKPKYRNNSVRSERCQICPEKHSNTLLHRLRCHSELIGIDIPFECFDCHNCFHSLKILHKHIKSHNNEPSICYICGTVYKSVSCMQKHLVSHSTERPHKCTLCTKDFKTRPGLVKHMYTHSHEKPHQCKVCLEEFTMITSLKLHERRHTGEKPYSCVHCKKRFSDGSTLKQHIRVHTGEKPYMCHICGRRTVQAGNLKSHYRHYHKMIVKNVSMYANDKD